MKKYILSSKRKSSKSSSKRRSSSKLKSSSKRKHKSLTRKEKLQRINDEREKLRRKELEMEFRKIKNKLV